MKRSTKITKVADVFRAFVQKHRDLNDEMNEGMKYKMSDPMADVVITEHDNKVRVTYDGAGYDQFSSQSVIENPMTGQGWYVGEQNKEKLNAEIKKIDRSLYIEECSSWALEVWVD